MKSRLRATALTLGAGLPLLALLAGCGGRGADKKGDTAAQVKTVDVDVARLEHRVVERTVEVVGSLRAWEQVTVGTKKEGRVVKVLHDIGDRVEPVELLVMMDPTDADLAVVQAERRYQAELAQLGLKALPKGEFDPGTVPAVVKAKVALERARNNLTRDRSLVRRGAGAKQDLDNSENDVQAAEAALADSVLAVHSTLAGAQATRATLDVAIQARRDMEIRAPSPTVDPKGGSGNPVYAVAKRSVSEGQFLKVGDPVMEIVIEKPLRLWTSVPERYTADVSLQQDLRVHVPAFPETTFRGKVVRINPTVDAVSRTFQVESLVTNDDGKLRPGGFAKASIVIDKHSRATVVPLESIVVYAGVTKVFVVDGDKARAVVVEPGVETRGWVEVVGKLPPDAEVVTTGQTQLAEGTPIRVRKPEAVVASDTRPVN